MGFLSKIMCKIQDRTKSIGENDVNIDYFDTPKSIGWNQDTELTRYIKNKNLSKCLNKLIFNANQILPLSKVIFKKNIEWIVSENQTGWTHKACCPFPSHLDKTPSFGYNSKDERFYCFGCQKSGQTVQFLAYLDNRSLEEIAKDILLNNKSSEDIILELDDSFDKINELLLSFSSDVRNFLQKNPSPKAFLYTENITWNLDLYLEKNVIAGTVNLDSLNTRINKLREQLSYFKD